MTISNLNSLRIASPCPASWAQMTGDDRSRYCELCKLHVYNLSELSPKEIQTLIADTEGRICARLYRRHDGTVITKDCPVGLRALRRRLAKRTAAVFATIISFTSLALGQKPSKKDTCRPQISISRSTPDSKTQPGLSGTIFDPNGAVVAGARIAVTDATHKGVITSTTHDDGTFRMAGLVAGLYDLRIESPGFAPAVVRQVRFDAQQVVMIEVILLPDVHSVTMGVISISEPLLDTDVSHKTIFTGDIIRRLPIPE